jgi:hypothetical protein
VERHRGGRRRGWSRVGRQSVRRHRLPDRPRNTGRHQDGQRTRLNRSVRHRRRRGSRLGRGLAPERDDAHRDRPRVRTFPSRLQPRYVGPRRRRRGR